MAAMEPLNSEKRHNFSSRRHIFTNKLSVYRFLGTRHLLTPTFMPKNDSFYRFYHILRKNMLCINLKLIHCQCKGDFSTARCSCRKNSLQCTNACGECRGDGCSNSTATYDVTEDDSVL